MKRSDKHGKNRTGAYIAGAVILIAAAGGGYFTTSTIKKPKQ